MVWIGNKKNFKRCFYHSRWKLTWNNTTFDLLAFKFSGNLHKMPDLTIKEFFWKLNNHLNNDNQEN